MKKLLIGFLATSMLGSIATVASAADVQKDTTASEVVAYQSVLPDDYLTEIEPNDSYTQANYMLPGDTYTGRFNTTTDKNDWYVTFFNTSKTATFTLSNIPVGVDYDLYLYQNPTAAPVAYSIKAGNATDSVNYVVQPGVPYYIKVFTHYNISSLPYMLTVN